MSGAIFLPADDDRALKRWAAVSLGLHLLLGVAGLIYGYARPLPPPVEMAMTVEFTSAEPPAQARGDQPGPAAPAEAVPAPPDPSPVPPVPEPPTNAPPQPTPPPPQQTEATDEAPSSRHHRSPAAGPGTVDGPDPDP
ncbi:hypothetical protein HB662_12580, partial [Roseomonas frigidaquae]|nr:hypothetical protein [Falsiroseomonas frigidaquae]